LEKVRDLNSEEAVKENCTAVNQRPVLAGPLHHSDGGSQYGAVAYQHRLVSCGIRGSMSRPGNYWNNAVVESFFATLKTELMRGRLYHTRQEARTEIFAYLEGFYNRVSQSTSGVR
jgi:putative transposase